MLYSTFFGGSYSDRSRRSLSTRKERRSSPATRRPPIFRLPRPSRRLRRRSFSSGFVAKLSADGSQAIYSSIIGASQGVTINGLAIDATGRALYHREHAIARFSDHRQCPAAKAAHRDVPAPQRESIPADWQRGDFCVRKQAERECQAVWSTPLSLRAPAGAMGRALRSIQRAKPWWWVPRHRPIFPFQQMHIKPLFQAGPRPALPIQIRLILDSSPN